METVSLSGLDKKNIKIVIIDIRHSIDDNEAVYEILVSDNIIKGPFILNYIGLIVLDFIDIAGLGNVMRIYKVIHVDSGVLVNMYIIEGH